MTSFHLFEDVEHRHVRFGLILQTHHRSLFCWTFWGTIKQSSLIIWVKWRHGVMTVFPLFEWVKAQDLYCYINSITYKINNRIKLVRWAVIKKTVGLASFGCTGGSTGIGSQLEQFQRLGGTETLQVESHLLKMSNYMRKYLLFLFIKTSSTPKEDFSLIAYIKIILCAITWQKDLS